MATVRVQRKYRHRLMMRKAWRRMAGRHVRLLEHVERGRLGFEFGDAVGCRFLVRFVAATAFGEIVEFGFFSIGRGRVVGRRTLFGGCVATSTASVHRLMRQIDNSHRRIVVPMMRVPFYVGVLRKALLYVVLEFVVVVIVLVVRM